MGYTATAPRPEKTHPTAKNRVWGFFADHNKTRPANRLQPAQPRRKIDPTTTKPASGVFFYGYRYYDPVTGRWASRDPVGELGGVNLYGFVGNNGGNRWDYLGMFGPFGAFIGVATDYALQVSINYACGKRGADAWTDIDGSSLFISGVFGAVGAPGVGGSAFKTYKAGKKAYAVSKRISKSNQAGKCCKTARQAKIERRLQRKMDELNNLKAEIGTAVGGAAVVVGVKKTLNHISNEIETALEAEYAACCGELTYSYSFTMSVDYYKVYDPNEYPDPLAPPRISPFPGFEIPPVDWDNDWPPINPPTRVPTPMFP